MSETSSPASERHASAFCRSIAISDQGLVLGDGSTLVRMGPAGSGKPRLSLESDTSRLLATLSVAFGKPVATADILHHVKAAADYWHSGDKALANFRLIFADLPRLRYKKDADRLRLAEYVLDSGVSPEALVEELGLSFRKYREDEPRVPAGLGSDGGQWTSDSSFQTPRSWQAPADRIAEDLPEEDQKTYETRRLTGQTSRQEDIEHGREGPAELPRGIGPGPYAGEPIPAGPGPKPGVGRQRQLNLDGRKNGCHECGTTDPGTDSGNFIGDHQRPTSLIKPGEKQYYLPHCARSNAGWPCDSLQTDEEVRYGRPQLDQV